MALGMHSQLNPQTRPSVSTAMAPTLAYCHRKWWEEKESASKHQIRSGNGKWARPCGVGRLNSHRETKFEGKNGDKKRRVIEKNHKKEESFGAQTEGAR